MLNKTMITLTAAIVLGSASAALAYEAPENRIGDRYQFLEQAYQPSSANGLAGRNVMPRQVANLDQYANEAPENPVIDRYPFLEPAVTPVASGRFAGPYLAQRQARIASGVSNQYMNEAPENKIGDRYPFLEPTYGRVTSRVSTAGRSRQATRG